MRLTFSSGAASCSDGLAFIDPDGGACPEGTFPEPNQSLATSAALKMRQCQPCDAGFKCPAGTVAEQECGQGTYNQLWGAAGCLTCPPGTVSREGELDQLLRISGGVGRFGCRASGLQGPGMPCPPTCPSHRNPLGADLLAVLLLQLIHCIQFLHASVSCPTGYTSCTLCAAGTYPTADGATCQLCPGGQFSPATGTPCQKCPPGGLTCLHVCGCSKCATFAPSAATIQSHCLPAAQSSTNPAALWTAHLQARFGRRAAAMAQRARRAPPALTQRQGAPSAWIVRKDTLQRIRAHQMPA